MTQKLFSMQLVFLAFALLLSGIFGAYAIYALLLGILVLAIHQIAKRQLWLPRDLASRLFLLSFLLFLISFALSAHDISDIIFTLNYSPMILFAPLAVFLASGANKTNTQALAWTAFAGLILIVGSAGLQVLVLGVRRAEGFEVDPIAMGHTAVILGFMAVAGFPGSKGWTRYILLLGPLLGIAGALLTGSRGPILGAVPLTIIALIFLTRRPLVSVVFAILAAAALLALLFFFWPLAFVRLETFYQMGQSLLAGEAIERSTGLRLEMYYGAAKAFLDSPIFGHGWENKFSALAPYFPADWAGFRGHHHLHADVADTAVANGMIGLIGYALIITAPVLGAITSARDSQFHARVYLASMLSVGYFFFGLTYLLFGYEYHTTLYVIFAAAIIGFCRDEAPRLAAAHENAV